MECPAHIDVQGFVSLAVKGKFQEAYDRLTQHLREIVSDLQLDIRAPGRDLPARSGNPGPPDLRWHQ